MTISLFTQLTGQIAEHLGLISVRDKQSAVYHQAVLWAIHAQNSEENLWDLVNDIEQAQATAAELGVTDANIAHYEAIIQAAENGKGHTEVPRGVPTYGKILEKRFISKDANQNMLTVQAGARTLEAVKQMRSIAQEDTTADIGKTILGRNEGELARAFIGKYDDEPKWLTNAQALNHMSDFVLEYLKQHPAMIENKDVKKSIEAMAELGARHVEASSTRINNSNIQNASDAPNILDKAAKDARKEAGNSPSIYGNERTLWNNVVSFVRRAIHTISMGKIDIRNAGDLTDQELTERVEKGLKTVSEDLTHKHHHNLASQINELVDQRLEQMKAPISDAVLSKG